MSGHSLEQQLVRALREPDSSAALTRLRGLEGEDFDFGNLDADGFRLASLLIARLRFERLVQGDASAERRFEDDPVTFVQEFRRYHAEVPMSSESPAGEARLFREWEGR